VRMIEIIQFLVSLSFSMGIKYLLGEGAMTSSLFLIYLCCHREWIHLLKTRTTKGKAPAHLA